MGARRRPAQARDRKRGRLGGVGLLATLVLLVLPFVSAGAPAATAGNPHTAFVSAKLAKAISEKQSALYDVIVTGRKGRTAGSMRAAVSSAAGKHAGGRVGARFRVIDGMAATMSGAAIEALADNPAIEAITPDAPVASTSTGPRSQQLWPDAVQVSSLYDLLHRADDRRGGLGCGCNAGGLFRRAGRRAGELRPAEQAERRGRRARARHLVAASQRARPPGTRALPPLRTRLAEGFDKNGKGSLGCDAAADWIYQHKAKYNIKVANFSLTPAQSPASSYDPLDQAVEKLWLGGVRSWPRRELRRGQEGERRPLGAGERPLRDHGRRVRHERHGHSADDFARRGRRTATRWTASRSRSSALRAGT